MPKDKIDVFKNELAFLNADVNNTDIIEEILIELENNVIPLLNKKSSYDILGKFYEEFLRFAGVANVKKGIVLTPKHITELFAKLIELKSNDIIFDPCCGSGSYLISGINKSNMLFCGDGKSSIYNIDFFLMKLNLYLSEIKPTIGFVKPPYDGKDSASNLTKKEIQFIEKMLDNVNRYGVVTAPISTYFKDDLIRKRIISKHTLKCVINMPVDLFQPNASTLTAIAVFETHIPHDKDTEVIFITLNQMG